MNLAKKNFEPNFFKPIPKCSLCITYNRKNIKRFETVIKAGGEGRKFRKIEKITSLYTINFWLFLIVLNASWDINELFKLQLLFYCGHFLFCFINFKIEKMKKLFYLSELEIVWPKMTWSNPKKRSTNRSQVQGRCWTLCFGLARAESLFWKCPTGGYNHWNRSGK